MTVTLCGAVCLRLSRDILLSQGPCFHHLTHHSNHFNETVIMLKRGLRGLDDTPINQALRAGLFYFLDSRDQQREEANKGKKSEDPSEKSKMHVLKTGLSVWLLQKSLPGDIHHQSYRTCNNPPERTTKQSVDWQGTLSENEDITGLAGRLCKCICVFPGAAGARLEKGVCWLIFLIQEAPIKNPGFANMTVFLPPTDLCCDSNDTKIYIEKLISEQQQWDSLHEEREAMSCPWN